MSFWSVKFDVKMLEPAEAAYAAAVIEDVVRPWEYHRVESTGETVTVHVRLGRASSIQEVQKSVHYVRQRIDQILADSDMKGYEIDIAELEKWIPPFR